MGGVHSSHDWTEIFFRSVMCLFFCISIEDFLLTVYMLAAEELFIQKFGKGGKLMFSSSFCNYSIITGLLFL